MAVDCSRRAAPIWHPGARRFGIFHLGVQTLDDLGAVSAALPQSMGRHGEEADGVSEGSVVDRDVGGGLGHGVSRRSGYDEVSEPAGVLVRYGERGDERDVNVMQGRRPAKKGSKGEEG